MTNKQINKTIAQACGWTELNNDPDWGWLGRPPNWIGKLWPVLNYCNDLNAMYEAEQQLWDKDWSLRFDFIDELEKLLQPTVWHRINATDTLDATARQRAEAFLRAIGKWEEVAK